MICLEDLLEELHHISTLAVHRSQWIVTEGRSGANPVRSPADRKFLQDLSERTAVGNKLSTKQAYVARKIIAKYARLFEDLAYDFHRLPRGVTAEMVVSICENPVYRQAPYQSVEVPREVKYLGNRKLAFKTTFSPQVVNRIKSLNDDRIGTTSLDFPYFNKEYRIWVVEVHEYNLEKVMNLIKKFSFQFDDDVVQFLADCSEASNKPSVAVVSDDTIHVVCQNNNLLHHWLEETLLVEESL